MPKTMILEAAQQAVTEATYEGLLNYDVVKDWSDDEVIAWYEKQMDFDREQSEEVPF